MQKGPKQHEIGAVYFFSLNQTCPYGKETAIATAAPPECPCLEPTLQERGKQCACWWKRNQKAAENRAHGPLFRKLIARAKKVAHHAQEMSTGTAATTETLKHFGGGKSRLRVQKAPNVTFVKLRSSSPVPGDIYQITQHKTYLWFGRRALQRPCTLDRIQRKWFRRMLIEAIGWKTGALSL